MESLWAFSPFPSTPPTSITGSIHSPLKDPSLPVSTLGTGATSQPECGSPWQCFLLLSLSFSVRFHLFVRVTVSHCLSFSYNTESLLQTTGIISRINSLLSSNGDSTGTQTTARNASPTETSFTVVVRECLTTSLNICVNQMSTFL